MNGPAERSSDGTNPEVRELLEEAARWKAYAMSRWAACVERDAEIAELHRRVEDLSRLHDQARGEAAALAEAIDALKASTSWRVTGPLRAVSGALARKASRP